MLCSTFHYPRLCSSVTYSSSFSSSSFSSSSPFSSSLASFILSRNFQHFHYPLFLFHRFLLLHMLLLILPYLVLFFFFFFFVSFFIKQGDRCRFKLLAPLWQGIMLEIFVGDNCHGLIIDEEQKPEPRVLVDRSNRID